MLKEFIKFLENPSNLAKLINILITGRTNLRMQFTLIYDRGISMFSHFVYNLISHSPHTYRHAHALLGRCV